MILDEMGFWLRIRLTAGASQKLHYFALCRLKNQGKIPDLGAAFAATMRGKAAHGAGNATSLARRMIPLKAVA
jgi:hypothetical protein